MIVLHRKDLGGNRKNVPPRSIYANCPTRDSLPSKNRLTFTYLTPPNYAESQVVSGGIGIARFLANI